MIDLSPPLLFAWAGGLALLMSTQYFFQPFLWRNWPLDEIFVGWRDVLADRLAVAIAIAAALATIGRLCAARTSVRMALLAAAVIAGAMAGEALTGWRADRLNVTAIASRSLRWSVTASAVAGIALLWRHGAHDAAVLARQHANAARLAAASTDAEAAALQRQIEPHFLFNTLATIRRHERTGSGAGRLLLERLLDYIDASLTAADARWSTLGAEADLARAYLDVCAARMGGRLALAFDIPEALRNQPLPPLMLVTLAENAVKHGIAPLPEGGAVTVCARRAGTVLVLTVSDSGAGLSGGSGNGIGLSNIATRLKLLYGAAARVTLAATTPRGALATLTVPAA